MKNLFTVSLCAAIMSSASVYAADITTGGIAYNKLPDGTLAVVANNYSGEITIPATLTYEDVDYRVTAIADGAFAYSSVSTVTIPEGVKSIGKEAFSGSYLTSIDLPNSLESIGEAAFQSCISATSINLGTGIKTIPQGCFYGCMFVENIVIPDQVETVGIAAFQGCGFSAQNLTLGTGLKYIGDWAFYNFAHIPTLTLPEGLLSIGDCAFEQSNNLKEITIPASVQHIGISPISGSSITKYIVKEGNTHFVSYNDALYTIDLTRIISYPEARIGNPEWPAALKTIGRNSCARAKFTEVSIPETVETIENAAFYNCASLTTLSIPTSVKTIGSTAFYGNESLDSINWNGASPETIGEMSFAYSGLCDVEIPEGVRDVEEGAFYGCVYLNSISFPKSTRTLGANLFTYCQNLEHVSFNEGLETIGQDIFYECQALRELSIPNSVKEIGIGLCYGCSLLEKVSIGSGISYIPEYAFSGCDAITEVRSLNPVPPANAYFPYQVYRNATLYVPAGKIPVYSNEYGWDEFYKILEIEDSGVSNIADSDISCRRLGNEIYISGTSGQDICVFDTTGKTIFFGKSNYIKVPDSIVIVKVGNQVFKL